MLLTINAGSSSLKVAVFSADTVPKRRLTATAERIGREHGEFTGTDLATGEQETHPLPGRDQAAAVKAVLTWLNGKIPLTGLTGVGHRMVHGGPKYFAPERFTAALLKELRGLASLDPDHLPAELDLVEICQRALPNLPHVAFFDTAFHRDLPRVAQLLPIPHRFTGQGVRRYGFHGLSCAYLIEELGRVAGPAVARGRVILAHLGSGASLTAVRDGRSVDTTMGFTPTSGIPMGTRTGDIDPGFAWYCADREQMSARQFHHMVNHESGLRGISGTSGDMRDLTAHEATDPRAADAVAVFCYQTRKAIGSLAAALGGLDTLVFAGGIGEHAPAVRARIVDGLEFLGVTLDPAQNDTGAPVISAPESRVTVRVMATDEELTIARGLQRLLAT